MTAEMNPEHTTLRVVSRSPEQTRTLGQQFGKAIDGGLVIALTGQLGSGKTRFAQGLARGLDLPAGYAVTSPTYTLINEYPARLRLRHADLYRLTGGDDLAEIGFYEMLDDEGVLVIEWADKLSPEVLAEHVAVHIDIRADDAREIRIAARGSGPVELVSKIAKLIGVKR